MFCKVLVLAAFAAVAFAVPVEKQVEIVSQENEFHPDGKYHFSYVSEDGNKFQQDGEVKQVEKETVVVSHGNVEYKGDDGKTYTLTFEADESGFHPHGDHLPVAPPAPEWQARAFEYIAAHPYVEDKPTKH